MTDNALGVRGHDLAPPSWKILPKSCPSVCLEKLHWLAITSAQICHCFVHNECSSHRHFNSWFWDIWKENEMSNEISWTVSVFISVLHKCLLETQLAYISPTRLCLQDLESLFTYQDKVFNSRNILVCQDLWVVCLSQLFFTIFLSCLLNLFQRASVSLKDKWAFWPSGMPSWTGTHEKLHYKLFLLTPAMKMAYNWLI